MAKAQMAEEPAGRLIMVALAELDDSPFQPRQQYDEDYLTELALSIAKEGVLQPVKVRTVNGRKQLVFGHCRKRGAERAGLTEIPAIEVVMDDATVQRVQLIENLQRKDISALDEAEALAKLVKLPRPARFASVVAEAAWFESNADRLTVMELAARIGKGGMSESYVRDRLRLTRLPVPAKAALQLPLDDPQSLSVSTAVLLARIPSDKLRAKACDEAYQPWDKTWQSFRKVKSIIEQRYMRQLKNCGFDQKDAALVPSAGACTTCPKLAGNNPLEYGNECRGDMCMDTACYDSKVAAARQRQVNAFAEKGLPVLDRKASNAVLRGKWIKWEKQHEWVLLDDKCQEDKKKRSFRALLGEGADGVTVAQTSEGLVQIIKCADAARLLAERHQITLRPAKAPRSELTPAERQAEEAADQRARDIRFHAALKACEQAERRAQPVYAARFNNETPALLRLLRTTCAGMADRYNLQAGRVLCAYLKLDGTGRAEQLWERIAAALQKQNGQNLLVFQCVLQVAVSLSRWLEWNNAPPPRDVPLFAIFGIELGDLLKAAKKEIEQEAAAAEAKRQAEARNAPPTEWDSPVLAVKRVAGKRQARRPTANATP